MKGHIKTIVRLLYEGLGRGIHPEKDRQLIDTAMAALPNASLRPSADLIVGALRDFSRGMESGIIAGGYCVMIWAVLREQVGLVETFYVGTEREQEVAELIARIKSQVMEVAA